MLKGVVIAGNFGQYQDFIRNNGLNPKEYKYCKERWDLDGLPKVKVYYTGQVGLNPLFGSPYLERVKL